MAQQIWKSLIETILSFSMAWILLTTNSKQQLNNCVDAMLFWALIEVTSCRLFWANQILVKIRQSRAMGYKICHGGANLQKTMIPLTLFFFPGWRNKHLAKLMTPSRRCPSKTKKSDPLIVVDLLCCEGVPTIFKRHLLLILFQTL